jgi:DNA mismatch endonuclease, patch repair protein
MVSDLGPSRKFASLRNQCSMTLTSRIDVPACVSLRMSKVRRANTSAELAMQKALLEIGVAFVTHTTVLGCKPDLLIKRYRIAIFVDGDFWHGRLALDRSKRALKRSLRKTPGNFWFAKIVRNIERDARQTRKLRRHGWSVFRFWASDVIKDHRAIARVVTRRVRARRRSALKTRASAA